MKWDQISWQVDDLAPQMIEILKILCENNLYPMCGDDVADWLKRRGYPKTDRTSVAVVVGRMRDRIRNRNFMVVTRHGPGGGYKLRPRG